MITLSDIREALKTKAADDPSVEALRQAVIDLWESTTGLLWDHRGGFVEEFAREHDEQRTVRLSLRPVTAISTVEERLDGAADWVLLAANQWEQIGRGELRRIGAVWDKRVRVTYDGGYDSGECPRDVRQALITQARFMTERNSDGKLIVNNQAFEGGSGSLHEADLHPLFKATAARRAKKF